MTQEIVWRPIPGWEDYAASSHGAVRRIVPAANGHKPKSLRAAFKNGYLVVSLAREKRMKQFGVHQLVALAFHGVAPTPQHQVAHNDGNRANNRSDNLRWATSKENHADRRRHGTAPTGEGNGRSKLTQSQAEEVRASPHISTKEYAEKFGVHVSQVRRIRAGAAWITTHESAA